MKKHADFQHFNAKAGWTLVDENFDMVSDTRSVLATEGLDMF